MATPSNDAVRSRESGFTLLEVLISMVILTLLLVGTLAISTETARFTTYADEDYRAQNEVQTALSKLGDVLHKTGRVTIVNTSDVNTSDSQPVVYSFPQVQAGGTELDFLLHTDIDGNGHGYDQQTGEIEWSPIVYTARLNPDSGTFGIFVDSHLLKILGVGITEVEFTTYTEDPTVEFKEIEVRIRADRTTSDGAPVTFTSTQSIHMRN
jgi:prepilin-type N-terminal cleavage/methylation domain-containing protein